MSATSPVIIVTGYGAVSALGRNCDSVLDALRESRVNNTVLSSKFFPEPFCAPCFQAELDDGLPKSWKENAGSLVLNRTIRLGLAAISEALQRAGIAPEDLAGLRVGLALGTTVGCTFHNESYYLEWKGGNRPDSLSMDTYLHSNLAECVQGLLGVKGPRAVITNACASGADAIGMAKSWLENDLCDIAVAGGVDELSRIACHGFKSLMLVSEESCRPFDRGRQGLNLGEGAGIMVLEREGKAQPVGRTVYGRILGYGIAGDGYHPTAPHPEGRGLQRAAELAIADAGLSWSDISMINAHGTGTPTNDKAETKAISAMGIDTGRVPVVSTKGGTGHTLGAAGAVEAVLTMLSLMEGEVSGTTGCLEPDPEFPFTPLVQGASAQLEGKIGISESLAFGGSNAVLVIEGCGP